MSRNLLDAYKINLWKGRLEQNGNVVRGIEELFAKYRSDGTLLFGLVNVDAVSPEGENLLPLCFIKGEVVCVLVCLIDSDTGKKYLLLVRQRRICDGSLTFEHPAGMLDDEPDPYVVAVREVHEETGIEVDRSRLVHLNPGRLLFPTTGTSDEAMHLFYTELVLSPSEVRSLHLQHRGEASENEKILTYVVPFEEGYKLITNTNGLLHCFMYLADAEDWELLKKLKYTGV